MGRPKKNAGASAISAYAPKKITNLEGTVDLIAGTDALWDILVKKFNRFCRIYGFDRAETPILEDLRLYENYYLDRRLEFEFLRWPFGAKTAVLRPEILPSILRTYFQNKIFETSPLTKWSYSGLVARQKVDGELFSDYEFGIEIFGTFTHLNEAQAVSGVWEFFKSLGLEELSLEINHIGEEACQRVYQEHLAGFLTDKKYDLCDSCNEHLKGRVLNVFRCNNLDCQALFADAPTILDFLDPISHKSFTNILEALDELGIPYQLNPLYAGPDGHSKTNFAIKYKNKNGQLTLAEGGYHDGLLAQLCGKNLCSFGIAGSLGRVYKILNDSKSTVIKEGISEVFLVPLGELASKRALRLFRDLTREKVSVYDHFGSAGVKNQLKAAETNRAPIALIMGQKEAMDEMVILRDVKSGMQEIISYDKIVAEVKKRLGK